MVGQSHIYFFLSIHNSKPPNSPDATEGRILRDFPDLEAEDIRKALMYAAEAVRERELPLATAS